MTSSPSITKYYGDVLGVFSDGLKPVGSNDSILAAAARQTQQPLNLLLSFTVCTSSENANISMWFFFSAFKKWVQPLVKPHLHTVSTSFVISLSLFFFFFNNSLNISKLNELFFFFSSAPFSSQSFVRNYRFLWLTRQSRTNKSIQSKWKQIESIKAKLLGGKKKKKEKESAKRNITHRVVAADN